MRTVQKLCVILMFVALMSLLVGSAMAQSSLWVRFDERGNGIDSNGRPLDWWTIYPGPDSPNPTLVYSTWSFAAGTISGDLLIHESPTGPLSDVVSFFDNMSGNYVAFYSEYDGDQLDLADVGLPTQFQTPHVTLYEQPVEGDNGVVYTPLAGQPGFNPSFPGLTYYIISDVPEPSTLILLGIGSMGMFAFAWRRRK
jgi:hypothetical protein